VKINLEGHVAMISGGLGDIGRAIALELATNGADISLGDIQHSRKAELFINQIERKSRRAIYQQVDVSKEKAVKNWVSNTQRRLGLPTLIIVNAAIVHGKNIFQISAEEWKRELEVNLTGAFYLSRIATTLMIQKKKAGRVVFIGSWAGHVPHPHIPTYCVAKAGMRMLCKSLAVAAAPHGILVNEVAPGYVDAGLSGVAFKKDPKLRKQALRRVPIKELATSEQVAFQVAHLCNPIGLHMTGSVVLMDGGLSLSQKSFL
jgi:glucose 1-dehydrogenase